MLDELKLSNLKIGQYFKFENCGYSYSYICRLISMERYRGSTIEVYFIVTKSLKNSQIRPIGFRPSVIIDEGGGLDENYWSVVKKTDSNYPKCSLCK